MINQDILEGNWKQIRGSVKNWWGKLTDDELDQIAGRRDRLAGKLQERYGYSRQKAEEEIHRFLDVIEGMFEKKQA